MKRTIALSLCALPALACGGLDLESGAQLAPPTDELIKVVEVDPCEDIASAALSDGAVSRDLACGLACGHPSRVSLSSVAEGYTDGNSLFALAWRIRCAEDAECDGTRGAELGFAHYLASRVDAVRTEVELTEALQSALDARVEAAVEMLADRSGALGPARIEIYADIPAAVARDFVSARDRSAENYELFETMAPIAAEELDAGSPSAATHTELNSIRNSTVSEWLDSSGLLLQECLDGSDRSSFLSAVIIRESEAVARMQERFEGAEEARDDGDSEEEIEARFGAVAELLGDAALPWTPAPTPINRSAVTESARQVCGVVEATAIDGPIVTVEFDRIRISPREFECVEGPSREVHWGERLIVLEDCGEFEDTVRIRPDPIQLSLADGQNLSEGNVIEAWITQDRSGSVSAIYHDDDSTVPSFIGAFANP